MSFVLHQKLKGKNFLLALLGATLCATAQATVYYEDFQGTNVAGNLAEDPYIPGTNFRNNPTPFGITIADVFTDLLTLSATPGSVRRSGTTSTINWAQQLCWVGTDPSNACLQKIEGRIGYAVVRFPESGAFTFTPGATDDYSRIDIFPITSASNALQSTFRTAAYQAGGINTAVPHTSPQAGSCVLLRYVFGSVHTENYTSLNWSGPSFATTLISDTVLSDPSSFDFSACVPQTAISKTASVTALTPGGNATYTITATNNAAGSAADGTVISDPLPTGIASATWSCVGSGGAVCPNLTGTGALNETIATFPAGGSLVYTMIATVAAMPPALVSNTVTATPPANSGGICMPGSTASPCTATRDLPPAPQVSLQKTARPSGAAPGDSIVYTLVATNSGSVAANGTLVSDPMPAGINSYVWTCAVTGTAVCPNASGSGALNETIATFPAGSTVTYTITAQVGVPPTDDVENIASMTPPAGGVCTPGNTPAPCTSSAKFHFFRPIPALSPLGLLGLIGLLALAYGFNQRRQRA